MPELFVELLSEEIPARMQRRAAEDLKRLVTNHLVDAGLVYEGATAGATPRRLFLSVSGLPARSADRTEERRGPRVGAPERALEGFLRAAGLSSIEEAEIVADPRKGDYYLARTRIPGRPAIEIAGEAIAEAVRAFPWPKSMRWGADSVDPGSLRWVRPLTSVVATFGAENEDPDVVPVDLAGVPVGDTTVGHRFHAPDRFRVRRLDDYRTELERRKVVADMDRRRDQILHDAKDRAFALGLELVEDEGLLEEVAGLVEWPVVLVGRFDESALELPDEVIRLTIRENQKCFVTRDAATGRLANAFILTANLETADHGAAIVAGNERVVRARLSDARFFYETDRKTPLREHGLKLHAVTFHERLGSQADRVARIAALASRIAPLVGADPDAAATAAELAKADLATGMVGEFPELQGYIGRRYAEAEGHAPEIAAAIEEHYRPLGPGDACPSAPVSIAVALADKADQIVALWLAGERPTGSGDPYGLRRAALGIIRLILENGLRVAIRQPGTVEGYGLLGKAREELRHLPLHAEAEKAFFKEHTGNEVDLSAAWLQASEQVDFILERFIVQQREAGVPAEIVRAIIPVLATVDLVDVTRRIAALQGFLATDDGANLMTGYRRAANILRAEEKDGETFAADPDPAHLTTDHDQRLAAAIAKARAAVAAAVAAEDYRGAMEAIAGLRAPVDAFFDNVRVNDENPDVRTNRLRLLAALREVTRQVADFSQIPG